MNIAVIYKLLFNVSKKIELIYDKISSRNLLKLTILKLIIKNRKSRGGLMCQIFRF